MWSTPYDPYDQPLATTVLTTPFDVVTAAHVLHYSILLHCPVRGGHDHDEHHSTHDHDEQDLVWLHSTRAMSEMTRAALLFTNDMDCF